MRSFILGIVILMAVPAYALGQQRDRPERSATGRTAIPREEAVQAARARQTDRRTEPPDLRTGPSDLRTAPSHLRTLVPRTASTLLFPSAFAGRLRSAGRAAPTCHVALQESSATFLQAHDADTGEC